jgi:hypothetical protein
VGAKIITKTDRQMEDRMLAVANDPVRADTLQKARAFKRTWLELAEALARVQHGRSWEQWGFTDFDAYCRKELHLRASIPNLATVEFVKKATERAAADPDTLQTIQRVAFDEGAEAGLLSKRFGELAFPQTDSDRRDKLRQQIGATARRLSSLIAEPGTPVPKKLAIHVEEVVGELLEAIEN